jgi:hypothetical protein
MNSIPNAFHAKLSREVVCSSFLGFCRAMGDLLADHCWLTAASLG